MYSAFATIVGTKAVVCADQAVPHISAVLHGRLQRDPAQVQEHGGQELRLPLIEEMYSTKN